MFHAFYDYVKLWIMTTSFVIVRSFKQRVELSMSSEHWHCVRAYSNSINSQSIPTLDPIDSKPSLYLLYIKNPYEMSNKDCLACFFLDWYAIKGVSL